jgi:hypothetical protein
MIVGAPRTTLAGDRHRIQVPVSLETPDFDLPEDFQVWYEVPAQYAAAVSADRGDAFAVALLFLAMRLHEDLRVKAPLSAQLVHSLTEYQRIFSRWFSGLQTVNILHEGLADPIRSATGTGVFFSGGVDSFFSLWSHLDGREKNPDYRITHGLYLDGFDTNGTYSAAYDQSLTAYQSLLERLGVDLIPIRTNLKTVVNEATTGWEAYGAFLVSNALLLQGLLRRCYVPSGVKYHDTAEGSHPLTDHLLSTETLEVIHDGAWATRVEKTMRLATWPVTYDHLYVCFGREDEPLQNCCRCEKCIRTMIALDLAGALDRYSTFPMPLERRHVRGWRMPYFSYTGIFARHLYEAARERGRTDLVRDLRYVLWNHRIRFSRVGQLLRRLLVLPAKRSAWISSLYYRLRGKRA